LLLHIHSLLVYKGIISALKKGVLLEQKGCGQKIFPHTPFLLPYGQGP